jgi:hypothetical protein
MEKYNVFIFGAGVSAKAGVALGAKTISDIFRIRNKGDGHLYRRNYRKVKAYCKKLYNIKGLHDSYMYRELAKRGIDFEDYFSRVFLSEEIKLFNEDIRNQRDVWIEPHLMRLLYWYYWHHLRNRKDFLVSGRICPRDDTTRRPIYIQDFLNVLNETRRRNVILTTNYDLNFEGELPPDVINYYRPDISPLAYLPEHLNNRSNILYLKLHGSINWVTRRSLPKRINIRNSETGLERHYRVDLLRRLFRDGLRGNHIKWIHTYFQIYGNEHPHVVIMPPYYYKGLSSQDRAIDLLIRNIWEPAEKVLRNAKRIIFSGLSLRDTDIMLQVLLKKNIKEGTKIYLIDSSKGEERREIFARYRKLFNIKRVNYIPMKFERFVYSSKLIRLLR